MRKLFESEKRTIRNLGQRKWGVELPTELEVVAEDYLDESRLPKSAQLRPIFNLDFRLDFCDNQAPYNDFYAAECALPNGMGGADVFLSVDAASMRPLSLHLILGAAYPIRWFRAYIETIYTALWTEATYGELELEGVPIPTTRRALRIENAAFCRVFVIGSDVCFLWLVRDERPRDYECARLTLVASADARVDCYVDAAQVVAIDGWISTTTAESDVKLMAIRSGLKWTPKTGQRNKV